MQGFILTANTAAKKLTLFLGLARLIELSVNWSIDNGKTIIDEHNETIDYLLLLF